MANCYQKFTAKSNIKFPYHTVGILVAVWL